MEKTAPFGIRLVPASPVRMEECVTHTLAVPSANVLPITWGLDANTKSKVQ